MTDCPNFGRVIGGCRFEARYDERPNAYRLTEPRGFSAADLHHMTHFRTYIHDICIRCGKTVKRA